MRQILLDTGAVVGLLRPGDRHHSRVLRFFSALRPNDVLLTTWPVITECAFVLRNCEAQFWDWLLASGVEVQDCSLEDIGEMRAWREACAHREVDFADASLVWLARRRGTNLIATTDFRDFQTYRLSGRKTFKLMISAS